MIIWQQGWMCGAHLGLDGPLQTNYIEELRVGHIKLGDSHDEIIWNINKEVFGSFSVRLVYTVLLPTAEGDK